MKIFNIALIAALSVGVVACDNTASTYWGNAEILCNNRWKNKGYPETRIVATNPQDAKSGDHVCQVRVNGDWVNESTLPY